MKHLLLTTIAAVLVVGCGPTKAPDISMLVAVAKGDIEAIKQHLAAGTDVNAKDSVTRVTSLHIATGDGHKEIVELLIAKGADVNAKDRADPLLHQHDEGETPLDWAIEFNRTEISDLLRKHGGKTAEELKAEGK